MKQITSQHRLEAHVSTDTQNTHCNVHDVNTALRSYYCTENGNSMNRASEFPLKKSVSCNYLLCTNRLRQKNVICCHQQTDMHYGTLIRIIPPVTSSFSMNITIPSAEGLIAYTYKIAKVRSSHPFAPKCR